MKPGPPSTKTKKTRTRKPRKQGERRAKNRTRRRLAVGSAKTKRRKAPGAPAAPGEPPELESFLRASGTTLVGGFVPISRLMGRPGSTEGLVPAPASVGVEDVPPGAQATSDTSSGHTPAALPPIAIRQMTEFAKGAGLRPLITPPSAASEDLSSANRLGEALPVDAADAAAEPPSSCQQKAPAAAPGASARPDEQANRESRQPGILESIVQLAQRFARAREAAEETRVDPPRSRSAGVGASVTAGSHLHKPVTKSSKAGGKASKKRPRRSNRRGSPNRPVRLSESEERIALLRLIGLGPRSSKHHALAGVFESTFRQLWPERERRESLITEIERSAWRQGAIFRTRRLMCPSWVPTIAARSHFRRELADRCVALWDAPQVRSETRRKAQVLLVLLARLDPAIVFLHRERLDEALEACGIPDIVESPVADESGVHGSPDASANPTTTTTFEPAGAGQATDEGAPSQALDRAGADNEEPSPAVPTEPSLAARHRVTDSQNSGESLARDAGAPEEPEPTAHAEVTAEPAPETSLPKLLTVPEVARLAGRSRKTIYEWLKDPDSPLLACFETVGGKKRFRRAGLSKAIARQKAGQGSRPDSPPRQSEVFAPPPESDQSTLAQAQRYFRRTRPLTTDELADFLGNSRSTISRWKCRRGLPFMQPGGRVLFDLEATYLWLKKFKF